MERRPVASIGGDGLGHRRTRRRHGGGLPGCKLKAGAIGVVRLLNGRIGRIIRHRRTAREQRRVAHLLAAGRPIPPKLRPALAARRNRQLRTGYRGGVYAGDVMLLRGIGSPRRLLEGWQQLVQGQLTTVSIPAGAEGAGHRTGR